MRLNLRLADPDKLEATATITMTVGEWRRLREQLVSQHPSWRLASAIDEAIRDAERVFYSQSTTSEGA